MNVELPDKEEFNIFQCTCESEPVFENHKDFIQHLKDIHGMKDNMKFYSKMIFHADATKWFQTNNELDFGEFKAYQFCRCLRKGKDREMWEDY